MNQQWVCTCRNQIVRSDGKADPPTFISRGLAPRTCKLIAMMSSLHGQIPHSRAVQVFYRESRAPACRGPICTQVLVNKASSTPSALGEMKRRPAWASGGLGLLSPGQLLSTVGGQVTCSVWTSVSSPLKQEGQSRCSFCLKVL